MLAMTNGYHRTHRVEKESDRIVYLFVYLLCLFVETVSTTKRNGLIDIDRPIKRATATAAAATASAEAVAAVSKKKKNYHG